MKCKEKVCLSCNRDLPNKSLLTKNGCVWCDESYWTAKQKLEQSIKKVSKDRTKS